MKIKKSLSVFLAAAMSFAFIPNTFAEAEDIVVKQFPIEDVNGNRTDINDGKAWAAGMLSKFEKADGTDTRFVKSVVLNQLTSSVGGGMNDKTVTLYGYDSDWNEKTIGVEGSEGYREKIILDPEKMISTQEHVSLAGGVTYSSDITEYYKNNCQNDYSVYVQMPRWYITKEYSRIDKATNITITYDTQAILDAVNSADAEQMTDLLLSYGEALGVKYYEHISETTRNFVNEALVQKSFTSELQLAQEANGVIDENVIKAEYHDLTDNTSGDSVLDFSALLNSLKFQINIPNNGYNLRNVAGVDLQLYLTNKNNAAAGSLYAANLETCVGRGVFDGGKNKYYSIDITDYAKSLDGDFVIAPTADGYISCKTAVSENKEYITVSYDKNGLLEELNSLTSSDELKTYFETYGYALGFDKDYISQYSQIVAEGLCNKKYDSLEAFKSDASDAAALAASAVISELNNASSVAEYRKVLESKYEMLGLDLSIYQQLSDSDKNKYLSQIKKKYETADEFKEAFNSMFSTALVLNTSVSNAEEMKKFIEANAQELGLDLTHYNRIVYKDNFLAKLLSSMPYADIDSFVKNYNDVLESRIKQVKTISLKEALSWYDTTNENGEKVTVTQASTSPVRYGDKLFKFDTELLKLYAKSENTVKIVLNMKLTSGSSINAKDVKVYAKSNDWSEASAYEDLVNAGITENSEAALAGSATVTVPQNGSFDIDITEYVKNAINNNTLGDDLSLKTDNAWGYYLLRDRDGVHINIYADVDSAVEEINNAGAETITESLINNAKIIDAELFGYKNLANKTDVNNELLSRKFNTAEEISSAVKEMIAKQTAKKQINISEEAGACDASGFAAFITPNLNISDKYRVKFDLSGVNMEYVNEITVSAARMNNTDPEDYNANVYDYESGNVINDFKLLAVSKGYNECDITDFAKTKTGEVWLAFDSDKWTYAGNIARNKAPYITVYYDIMHIVEDIANAPSQDDAEFIIMQNMEVLGITNVNEISMLASLLWNSTVSSFAEYTEIRNGMQSGGIVCTAVNANADGDNIVGTVKVTNLTSMEAPLTVVVAAYTEKNEMISAVVTAPAGNKIQAFDTNEMTYTLKDTAFTPKSLKDAYEVRAIMYNSLSDLMPYAMQKATIINR